MTPLLNLEFPPVNEATYNCCNLRLPDLNKQGNNGSRCLKRRKITHCHVGSKLTQTLYPTLEITDRHTVRFGETAQQREQAVHFTPSAVPRELNDFIINSSLCAQEIWQALDSFL